MRAHPFRRSIGRRRDAGFGLVEILVGVTIGLIALLIVYQALALSEGYRRTTTAGGDAQSAGMISSFVLASDLANGGLTVQTLSGPTTDWLRIKVGASSSWKAPAIHLRVGSTHIAMKDGSLVIEAKSEITLKTRGENNLKSSTSTQN